MRRVVGSFKIIDYARLIERIQQVGQKLTAAQPKEMAVGNIVRRVLGVIRDEAEEDRDGEISGMSDAGTDSRPHTPRENEIRGPQRPGFVSSISAFSPLRHGGIEAPESPKSSMSTLSESFVTDEGESSFRPPPLTSHASYTSTTSMMTSMFSLLSHPVSGGVSQSPTPSTPPSGSHTPLATHAMATLNAAKELKDEVIKGIEEIIDELDQADDQIAGYALDHIHSNEMILTHASSVTVQKFLLKAAAKRKFTVIHAEAFPNHHESVHATVTGNLKANPDDELGPEIFTKSLTAAGITVILIPDSAVFALMSRVNKVILDTHVVLANGGLVTSAGAKAIAMAARMHRTPVVVLTGVYKLSPVHPFDFDALIEYGDAGKVFGYEDGDLVDKVDVENPLFDYVPADLVDLYITNLWVHCMRRELTPMMLTLNYRGGHAPSYLYRIVSDHYRSEDTHLTILEHYQ